MLQSALLYFEYRKLSGQKYGSRLCLVGHVASITNEKNDRSNHTKISERSFRVANAANGSVLKSLLTLF